MHQVVRFHCDECGREYTHPDLAESCEIRDREIKAARLMAIDEENHWVAAGHDTWHDDGLQHAPRVDPDLFGSHDYEREDGTSNCKHGCGCWMGPARSGGPVNPFGACPNNPKLEK